MSNPANPDIVIRVGDPRDRPFIASTWRESFSKSHTRWSLGENYFRVWPAIIELLIQRSDILIATAPDDPTLIVGYIVYVAKSKLIHFVYTRGRTNQTPGLQRAGVATALLGMALGGTEPSSWTVTHETKTSGAILTTWTDEGRPVPSYLPILNVTALG
jgi:hypothetical protein